MPNSIVEALRWRYAVKTFDPQKKVPKEELAAILESGRLAPSTFGIEAWKFLVVESPELREKLRVAAYGQTKVTDASHLIVITRRTDVRENTANELIERAAKAQGVKHDDLDGLRKMVEGAVGGMSDEALQSWVTSLAFIPLGMMLESAALLSVDACPMGGYNADQVNEILGLKEKHLAVTSMLALGYRGEDPAALRPKIRREFGDVVEFI